MTDLRDLDELLRATDGDVGCAASANVLGAYVQLQIGQEDSAGSYPGTAIHLRTCPACRADYGGLLGAARRFGDMRPE